MHYIQKYLDNLPKMPKWQNSKMNGEVPHSGKKTNIFLYCNYYSFYSQKVLMALYEKNVDFEPLMVDITKGEQYSSWFLEINPRGEIPVLKVNDNIIPDSTRILDHLELYLDPELPSLVNVSSDFKVVNNINKFRELIEALPSGVITVGSFFQPHLCGRPKLPFILPVRELLKTADMGSSNNLRKLAEENPKAKSILLYKAEIQDRKHEILTSEEEYIKVLNIVDRVLEEVEAQLKTQNEGNWLCCENFSIADINLAVLLQRLWELGFEDRYWAKGKRPLLENYYERVKQRESFKKAIPNLPFHIKMIIMSQPPAYVGAAGVVSVGVVVTVFYILKKLIR
ncbi:ganglioside-induced differentiation-associated protein 1 [Pectinophora gossypiella]|uniref:ganglioside-induced differentiation-associated protein 1 n=1 Tax=Pectinophora gossypiella TaxID=13191 RepID=UPI00214E6C32|nr:ganglioside-induced differentiation-associated protein 1 [Pectinophora gossypiella]